MKFSEINSLTELRHNYLQLAKINHPDVGGSHLMMQQLNQAYQKRKSELQRTDTGFELLQVGDELYVNGTLCDVILVTQNKFVARAKGRSKQAWFNKKTGLCIDYPFYKAGFSLGLD